MTQISTYQLQAQDHSAARGVFAVLGGSILIALFAQVAIPLPFTPVPLALQNHICLLLGALLGARRGSLAVLLYLFQGMIGLPVFALGKSGLLHLLGPTGGYLLGYALAAYLVGYLVEKFHLRTPRKAVLSMALGSFVIFLCGALQLSLYLGLKSAFILGVLPFLAGDMIKLMLAYYILKALRYSPTH